MSWSKLSRCPLRRRARGESTADYCSRSRRRSHTSPPSCCSLTAVSGHVSRCNWRSFDLRYTQSRLRHPVVSCEVILSRPLVTCEARFSSRLSDVDVNPEYTFVNNSKRIGLTMERVSVVCRPTDFEKSRRRVGRPCSRYLHTFKALDIALESKAIPKSVSTRRSGSRVSSSIVWYVTLEITFSTWFTESSEEVSSSNAP